MRLHELRDTLLPWMLIVGLYAFIFGALIAIQHIGLVNFTNRVADLSDLWTTMPMVALMLTMLMAMISVFVWSNISGSARSDQLPELLRERMERMSLQGLAIRGIARCPLIEATTPFAEVVGQLALSDASSLVVLDGEETKGLVSAQGIVRTFFYRRICSPDWNGDSHRLDELLDITAGELASRESLVSVDCSTSLYDVIGLMMSRRLTEIVMVKVEEDDTITLGTVQLLDLVAEFLPALEDPPSSRSMKGERGRGDTKEENVKAEGPSAAWASGKFEADTVVLNRDKDGKQRRLGLAAILSKRGELKKPPDL